jgi:hypothetical protein
MKTTVFANGIWKSGNNLLIKLCELLGIQNANWGIAASLLLGRGYYVRRLIRGPRWARSPISVGVDIPISIGSKWLSNKIIRSRGKCFGGHAAYSDHLLHIMKQHGVYPIQIVRDPRDVIVSFAHWIETRPDYYAYPLFAGLSIPDRMLMLIRGGLVNSIYYDSFATIMDRSYGWLNRTNDVLVVRFEDIVGANGGGSDEGQIRAVKRIVDWVGLKEVNVPEIAEKVFGGTPTFRKGLIGSWKDEFIPEVEQEFNRVIGNRLSEWGYE